MERLIQNQALQIQTVSTNMMHDKMKVVLVLCFLQLVGEFGQAMIPFRDGMVLTPHGYRPWQCVHKIEESNHLISQVHSSTNPGVIVEHPDSNRKVFYPQLEECIKNSKDIISKWKSRYGHSKTPLKTQNKKAQKQNIIHNSTINNIIGAIDAEGWVLYGYDYTPQGSNIHSFYATYVLPNEDPVSSGQILYYFIGLTDMTDNNETILQPVIAYCPDGNCGYSWNKPGWMGADWNCCPSGMTWYSESISLNKGSTIDTSIECNDNSGIASIKLIDQYTNEGPILNLNSDYRYFDFATVTLEAYDFDGCVNLNSMAFEFDEMKLNMIDGSNWQPRWTPVNELQDCQANIQFSDDQLHATLIGNGL